MENQISPESIMLFGINRNITNLFKDFLVILEELERDHNDALRGQEPYSPKKLLNVSFFLMKK